MSGNEKVIEILISLISWGAIIIVAASILFGCTISFQNISTHGTATDLVDQTQSAEPDVDANLQVPALWNDSLGVL